MFAGIVEFLGWFGAVTVLAGYLLFSTGRIQNGPVYQLFNLVGGLSVAVNVAAHHAVPSTIVNGIWAVVAAVVLVKWARSRRRAAAGEPTTDRHDGFLAEPPTTTAVLPVIGPAVRDHEPEATDDAGAAPGLPAATAQAVDAPAPMTETVPVITAALTVALVAAANQHAARQDAAANQHAARQDAAQQQAAE